MKTSTFHAAVAILTLAPVLQATSYVSANVNGTPGRHVADQTFTSTATASARAYVNANGDSLAYTQPSGAGACPEQGPSVGGLEALACAQARTVDGSLGVKGIAHGSQSYPSPEALATASIEDTFNFVGVPLLDIDIDFNSIQAGDGDWVLDFRIATPTGNSDHPYQSLYEYHASSIPFTDGSGNGAYRSSVTRAGDLGMPVTQYFQGVDGSFEDVLAIRSLPTDEITLLFRLATIASCYENSCSSIADALNTARIGIRTPYISQNGYQYPGADDPEPVPEPGAFLLVAAGLGALTRLNRNRR